MFDNTEQHGIRIQFHLPKDVALKDDIHHNSTSVIGQYLQRTAKRSGASARFESHGQQFVGGRVRCVALDYFNKRRVVSQVTNAHLLPIERSHAQVAHWRIFDLHTSKIQEGRTLANDATVHRDTNRRVGVEKDRNLAAEALASRSRNGNLEVVSGVRRNDERGLY